MNRGVVVGVGEVALGRESVRWEEAGMQPQVTPTGGRSLSHRRLRRISQGEDENQCDAIEAQKGRMWKNGGMSWTGSPAAERGRKKVWKASCPPIVSTAQLPPLHLFFIHPTLNYSPALPSHSPLSSFSSLQKTVIGASVECGAGRVNTLTDGIFYLQSIWTRPQDYDSKHLDFINVWSVIVYWHSPVPAPEQCGWFY